MSKATVIRKKALDLVRRQEWQGAIKEYRRLVDLDQSNPNVHNELADIYLKTGDRAEAYESFVRAIDEYSRVGLYNNAVAVAKKVMRVLPARSEVLVKLGAVRMKQGLAKEAESYYASFIEKAQSGGFNAEAFGKLAGQIQEEMATSPSVMQLLADCLLTLKLHEPAGDVLIQLHIHLESNGGAAATESVRKSIEQLGLVAKLDAARTAAGLGDKKAAATPAAAPDDPARTVVTEENIWTRSHSEGERIEIESTPRFTPPGQGAAPDPQPAGAAPGGPSERDQYLLRLARGVGSAPQPGHSAPAAPPAATDAGDEAREAEESGTTFAPASTGASSAQRDDDVPVDVGTATIPEDPETGDAGDEAIALDETPALEETMEPAGTPAAPDASAPAVPGEGDPMQISALIDETDAAGGSDDDYRSHYDLGMAYLEMELLAEAIREYQAAARSPQYQVKCLEMIGLCFVRLNQPQLAIKQLTKGLSLVRDAGNESLGIRYNLGLAYEMIGDSENARAQFEDVYVVDVTFRDVAEKMRKLGGL